MKNEKTRPSTGLPQFLIFNFAFFISKIGPAPVQLAAHGFEEGAVRQPHQPHGMAAAADGDLIIGIQLANDLANVKSLSRPASDKSPPLTFSATLPVVSEYQKLMHKYAAGELLSFSTLEGFITAKITVEALKRAGPKPTREKVLKVLNAMGELNLGGVYVNYSPKARNGWGGVDLTVIGANGKLLR